MRIGELAALVGVSTRTVRHYHRLGLLPEPVRRPNGYREYRMRDAVVLARVRRLAELGLSLDEIREVLAEDHDRELREVLLELDADLARQQETIGERRERLASLLADPELHPDSAVSPDMAAVLRELPAGGSKFAEADREMLTFVCALAGPEDREHLLELLRPLTEPEAVARGQALYERMDELADASPGDPRIGPLASDLAAHLPDGMAAMMLENLDQAPEQPRPRNSGRPYGAGAPGAGGADQAHRAEGVFAEMQPAHAEVLRLTVAALARRERDDDANGNGNSDGRRS
ncbi:MerR family transcriptional regulator [Streptomyces abyssalis]|uniref:MerR family transcriptional regulator n=1 Tax=Streptomyces abyssalis TaxID=933944 RepID=A0A1E7JFZ6_9ACTN|nr:MerR family transcriptional regulator [Streptomyces abyssalis]OEU85394.1 MerR family transcriptional regulator [Streptomyces abyssalis]OEU93143.1 MerR family transcriptional regulator [Streptomyces abyssalis]